MDLCSTMLLCCILFQTATFPLTSQHVVDQRLGSRCLLIYLLFLSHRALTTDEATNSVLQLLRPLFSLRLRSLMGFPLRRSTSRIGTNEASVYQWIPLLGRHRLMNRCRMAARVAWLLQGVEIVETNRNLKSTGPPCLPK